METHFGLGSLTMVTEFSKHERSSWAWVSIVMGERGDWGWSTIMGVLAGMAGGVAGGGDTLTSSSPRSRTLVSPSLPVSITSIIKSSL